jgi:hypothetical protein
MCSLTQVIPCIILVVLTTSAYKKNSAYELLRNLSRKLYVSNPDLQDDYATISHIDIKDIVMEICVEYQNVRNVDKVSMAQERVGQVAQLMQRNVQDMTKNIQSAEVGWFHNV